jgi:hypothetical protein
MFCTAGLSPHVDGGHHPGVEVEPGSCVLLLNLARAFFEMLQDLKERERRKVTIQIWAESLRDKGIRRIVERGLRQRDLLTASFRTAQRAGQLPPDLDPEALSRGVSSCSRHGSRNSISTVINNGPVPDAFCVEDCQYQACREGPQKG